MRYSLWSNNRLVGHTTLDLRCHQNAFRHGFLEPTRDAAPLLVDATGVAALCASRPRNWSKDDAYFEAFARAVERREALNFVLIDEGGRTFNSDFIRIYDLTDQAWEYDDYDRSYEEEVECLDPFEADDELDADIFAEMAPWTPDDADLREPEWSPPDARWDTMQYYIQVYVKRADDERPDFAVPP